MAQTKIKAGLFEGIIGNGTDGYFLMSNGDGTMTWSSVVINPTITDVDYPGTATAADPAGGETITLTGTGFKTGATVTVGGTSAPSVSYVSATQITFTTPAKTAGDYDVVVTNTDTGSATFINGISFNGIPAWTTAAGSLGTFASNTTISTITLQATEPDAGTITFNITNGALPTGLSLTGANIDGTTSILNADTLYTFTVTATDDENQATPRTFTITVQKEFISSENFTINTYTGNGSTQSIEGKIGTAAEFNGSSSYIDVNKKIPESLNFSFSFWFQTTSTATNQYIFSTKGNSATNGWWIQSDSGTIRYGEGNGSANGTTQTSPASTYADGSWHHAVVTRAAGGTVNMYIDGGQVITNGSVGSNYMTSYVWEYDLHIGRYAGSALYYYNGKLDQIRVFDKVLSSSEVTTLYGESNTSTTKSTTDIFDDGSGVALYEFEKGAIDTGGVSGYIGNGGIFNGSSSYIEVPSFSFGSDNIAVSMWVNPESTQTAYSNLFDFNHSSGTAGTFSIQQDNANTNQYKIWQWNGSSYNETTTVTLNANQWNHLVFSLQSNGSYVIYLNGSSSVTGSNLTASTSAATEILSIGRWLSAGTPGRYFNGKMDQIRIFNKALSSSEVTTLYGETSASATKSTTDIFDDGSGVALYELEGNANDTGRGFGQSAVFNGSTSNINFGNVLNTTFESNWSVSAWINFNSGTSGAIFQKGPNILNGEYIRLYTRSSTPRIQFGYSDGSANGVDMSTNSYDPGGKGWVHVVGTADYSGSFKLYVNGSLVETQTVTGGAPSFSMTDPLYIGYNGGGGGYANGNIDDVRLYSFVLTSTDVEYLYKNDISNIPTANLTSHWKLDGNANDSIGSINGAETDITYSDGVAYNGTATNVSYAYNGTPTNVSFVGTSFQPDLVWIKPRSIADNHNLFDSIRGTTKQLISNNTSAESTQVNTLTSFDSNGFTIGSDNNVNTNNATHVAWCWKAASSDSTNTDGSITSTVRANQDAGFSIVKYTGNSTAGATVGHGLSTAPDLIIAKGLEAASAYNWMVYASPATTTLGKTAEHGHTYLNLTNPYEEPVDQNIKSIWNDTAPTSTVFSISDNININANGAYIAYCFHSVDGYQKIGSYTGTGATGNVINVGFKPRFLMWKKTNGAVGWFLLDGVRNTTDVWSARLEAHNANAEAGPDSYTVTVSDTGFEMTGSFATWTGSNELNSTYIYLAIA